jgi:hypothetical protein
MDEWEMFGFNAFFGMRVLTFNASVELAAS